MGRDNYSLFSLFYIKVDCQDTKIPEIPSEIRGLLSE